MFRLQIHARAECTMNEKFCILHEAAEAECSIQNFEFSLAKFSLLIYNLSPLVVLASKSRTLLWKIKIHTTSYKSL